MLTKKLSVAAACFAIMGTAGCEVPGEYGYGSYGHNPGYTSQSSAGVAGATADNPLFSTNEKEYRSGGFVNVSLNNTTRGVMNYNLCRSTIERFDGGWRPVHPVSQSCTAEVRSLYPGQSTTYTFQFPPLLDDGQYRVRTNVGGRALVTNSFVVRRVANDG